MYRIINVLIPFCLLIACKTGQPNYFFSELKQKDHSLIGMLEIKNLPKKKTCEELAKTRVLDKFMFEGFEATSYWRPRDLKNNKLPNSIRKQLYENIYISENQYGNPGNRCKCTFQFNINSTLIQLENEGLIKRFGY